MTSPAPLTLYTREDCHLCEQAARMLQAAGLECREVDVDADPELAARYGLAVPVVRRADTGAELHYPFDEAALSGFARQSNPQ